MRDGRRVRTSMLCMSDSLSTTSSMVGRSAGSVSSRPMRAYHYGRRQASGIGLGGTVPARQHSSIRVTNASGNLAFHASKVKQGKARRQATVRRQTCSTSSVESRAFCVTTFATTCARQRVSACVRAHGVLWVFEAVHRPNHHPRETLNQPALAQAERRIPQSIRGRATDASASPSPT